jgi:glucose-6-phosphate 1-dehydrogenase
VPFYIRAGKNLPVTSTEVVATFRRPPATKFSEHSAGQNYMRFRISPDMVIAMGVCVLSTDFTGEQEEVELEITRHPKPDEMGAYERVLHDAMIGDATIFARQDYVEEAWRIIDPVMKGGTPVYQYEPHTWGPKEVERVTPPGGWIAPVLHPHE